MVDRDACPMALGVPYFVEEDLPWVVLFARALELTDRDARLARARTLAAEYRELFGG